MPLKLQVLQYKPASSWTDTILQRCLRSFLYLVAWIFLILVVTGNVSKRPVPRETYFLKIDLSNIIPVSVSDSDAVLVDSIARSIGLHDFYQVGLWNFCEGYNHEGVTRCSKPKSLYWFNPLEIILNELLSGATSTFPFHCPPFHCDKY